MVKYKISSELSIGSQKPTLASLKKKNDTDFENNIAWVGEEN